ncbi:ABC transporter ATP-binding protein [Shouchella sp. JSM 1781072]|uniref:ABC transporter ATP-binding protein n=1 Tax=Shouchella sp. JSM 1781072 TaxID=3344581 RepID=UPI0035BFD299
MNVIETTNLKKQFQNEIAVDDLNLTIKKGELYALLGLNGAGKTTVIKMLTTILKPSSGEATVYDYSIKKEARPIKQLMGVSPQETAIAPNLTIRENVFLMAQIYGISKKEAEKKSTDVLSQLDLTDVEKKKAAQLSGGMQRRLSIAMALISDPKVLFLDEPTLGIDVIARRELWEVIRDLKEKMTIILTTHHMEEADSLADRIGIMAKGQLIKTGTPAELKEQMETSSLEAAFVSIVTKKEKRS